MTLSDKFIYNKWKVNGSKEKVFTEEDVKEFIIKESHLLQDYITGEITWEEMCDKRKKLIGDDLI